MRETQLLERIAARSNGEGRNALAACASWWEVKRCATSGLSPGSPAARALCRSSFSPSQEGRVRAKAFIPCGARARKVSSVRLNFRIGFSWNATASMSPTPIPACARQAAMARRGKRASFFRREKRSSWAAATIRPSTTRAAAESW
jgi:hypothetical protein